MGPARVIRSLWVDNGGCRLPCWWGITPGETSWEEAKQFLESIDVLIEKASVKMSNNPNAQGYIGYYWNQKSDDSNSTHFSVYEGTVQMISIDPETTGFAFQHYQLLSTYGQPDQILMRRLESCTGLSKIDCPYFLTLFYEEQRFLAHFHITSSKPGEPLKRCILFSPRILSWSKNETWDEQRLQSEHFYGDTLPYQSIEEVANIDVATFYERFQNPDVEACIELKD